MKRTTDPDSSDGTFPDEPYDSYTPNTSNTSTFNTPNEIVEDDDDGVEEAQWSDLSSPAQQNQPQNSQPAPTPKKESKIRSFFRHMFSPFYQPIKQDLTVNRALVDHYLRLFGGVPASVKQDSSGNTTASSPRANEEIIPVRYNLEALVEEVAAVDRTFSRKTGFEIFYQAYINDAVAVSLPMDNQKPTVELLVSSTPASSKDAASSASSSSASSMVSYESIPTVKALKKALKKTFKEKGLDMKEFDAEFKRHLTVYRLEKHQTLLKTIQKEFSKKNANTNTLYDSDTQLRAILKDHYDELIKAYYIGNDKSYTLEQLKRFTNSYVRPVGLTGLVAGTAVASGGASLPTLVVFDVLEIGVAGYVPKLSRKIAEKYSTTSETEPKPSMTNLEYLTGVGMLGLLATMNAGRAFHGDWVGITNMVRYFSSGIGLNYTKHALDALDESKNASDSDPEAKKNFYELLNKAEQWNAFSGALLAVSGAAAVSSIYAPGPSYVDKMHSDLAPLAAAGLGKGIFSGCSSSDSTVDNPEGPVIPPIIPLDSTGKGLDTLLVKDSTLLRPDTSVVDSSNLPSKPLVPLDSSAVDSSKQQLSQYQPNTPLSPSDSTAHPKGTTSEPDTLQQQKNPSLQNQYSSQQSSQQSSTSPNQLPQSQGSSSSTNTPLQNPLPLWRNPHTMGETQFDTSRMYTHQGQWYYKEENDLLSNIFEQNNGKIVVHAKDELVEYGKHKPLEWRLAYDSNGDGKIGKNEIFTADFAGKDKVLFNIPDFSQDRKFYLGAFDTESNQWVASVAKGLSTNQVPLDQTLNSKGNTSLPPVQDISGPAYAGESKAQSDPYFTNVPIAPLVTPFAIKDDCLDGRVAHLPGFLIQDDFGNKINPLTYWEQNLKTYPGVSVPSIDALSSPSHGTILAHNATSTYHNFVNTLDNLIWDGHDIKLVENHVAKNGANSIPEVTYNTVRRVTSLVPYADHLPVVGGLFEHPENRTHKDPLDWVVNIVKTPFEMVYDVGKTVAYTLGSAGATVTNAVKLVGNTAVGYIPEANQIVDGSMNLTQGIVSTTTGYLPGGKGFDRVLGALEGQQGMQFGLSGNKMYDVVCDPYSFKFKAVDHSYNPNGFIYDLPGVLGLNAVLGKTVYDAVVPVNVPPEAKAIEIIGGPIH
ncbi:MAG: hypothetical protein QW594_01470 [Candidatus Woesearchaeota archaeon]